MGNALHAGDGLTLAEISAIESYSIGMTSESRTTTDDNTASVNTREQPSVGGMRQQLTGASDDRDSGGGGGRLHHKRSIGSKSSVSRPSRNSNRRPGAERERERPGPMNRPPRYESNYSMEGKEANRPSPRYDKKYSKESPKEASNRGPRTSHDNKFKETVEAGRIATRYDKRYMGGDGSRTETSSAYHHGYRMEDEPDERRDDQEDETYQEVGTYREYEGYEYRYENENNHLNSYSNIKSKSSHHSNHQHHQQQQRHHPTSDIHIYDTTHHEETETLDRDGISTLADIPPAETDMAYAGSEEEELADTPPENEVPKYRFEANRNTGMSKDHYAMNGREKAGPNFHYQTNDITEQEKEFRRSNYPYHESRRDVPSTSSRRGRPVVQEPSIEQRPEDDGLESMPGSSFSTLTKTLTTYAEDPAVFAKEQERNLKNEIRRLKNAAFGSFEQMSAPPVDYTGNDDDDDDDVYKNNDDDHNDDSDEANPAQRKLEELLRQQRLQEEKLQKQLEQLRIQKEKLQQLQEEKVRNSRDHDKGLQANSMPHYMQDQEQQDWSLPSLKKTQIVSKPSRESSKNVKTSVESSRQERTRRERLEKARSKVMPLSPSRRSQKEQEKSNASQKSSGKKPDGASNFDKVDAEVNNAADAALEEKYAGQDGDEVPDFDEESSTGTATGEIEGSFVPEYEDVPSHCKIDEAPFQETDLTTISASHFSNELNHMSTVSSIKDKHAGGNNEQYDYDERLNETFSSMDEEIDLDFVAKYDKAFNAFLDRFPSLFDRNSELIQNLKVAKLQRILEVSYQTECALEAKLETPSVAKTSVEAEFQKKLKEASRQKAERSIQFRADLNHVKKETKTIAGELTWDMVQLSIKRAKKLQKIKAELNSKDLTSRENLLAAMPDGPVTDEIRKAMRMSTKDGSKSEQKKELQQFQVDNAILASEVKVLQERVEALKEEAKKKEWVDSTLVRMDEKKLKKLKSRYQKKLGASF